MLVIKQVPFITLGEKNQNPTAFIDTDGSLIGCFGKAVFHCVPKGLKDDIPDQAGQQYYYDYPDMSTKWALTATTQFPDGTSETITFRWKVLFLNESSWMTEMVMLLTSEYILMAGLLRVLKVMIQLIGLLFNDTQLQT